MARYCRGAGRTAIAVDARQPINYLSSLMEAVDSRSRSWHCYTIFPFFSLGRVSVISIELTSIPKNCIFWHGSSTDFLRFIKKPRFWRRYIRVPLANVSSSFEAAISRISSRKMIIRTYNFLNREMRVLINFMHIFGAGPKPKQRQRNC